MITGFNKATANNLNEKLEVALRKFAEDNGLDVKRGGGRFDDVSFTPKFTFSVKGKSSEMLYLETYLAAFLGIKNIPAVLEAYKKESGYTLLGYRSKASSKPYIIEKNGQKFITSPLSVEPLLRRLAMAAA